MLDNPSSEGIFPKIQSKPPFVQPEAVSSHPIMRLTAAWSPSQLASGKVIQALPPARSPPSPRDVTRLDGSLPCAPRPSSPLTSLTTLLAALPPLLFSFGNLHSCPRVAHPPSSQHRSATNPSEASQGLWAPGDLLAMRYAHSPQPAWINTTASLSMTRRGAEGGPGWAESDKH